MNVVTFFYLGTEVKKTLLDFFFTFSGKVLLWRGFFKLVELADSCSESTSFFRFYLYFLLDHSYGYIIDAFSKKGNEGQRKNDLRKAMEIWHPDKFFPRFGHRIPNEEEEGKIKNIVNHVSAALISGYQK